MLHRFFDSRTCQDPLQWCALLSSLVDSNADSNTGGIWQTSMDNLASKPGLFAQAMDGGRLLWTYYVELKILVSAVQFRPSAPLTFAQHLLHTYRAAPAPRPQPAACRPRLLKSPLGPYLWLPF